MRSFIILLGLLVLATEGHAADFRPAILREATRCAAAWQRNDFEGVLGFLPPQVIKQSGGRAAALKKIKNEFNLARDYGVDRIDFRPRQPATPQPLGKWLTTLVPLAVVLHRTPVDVTQQTHLLALSNDQGRHWYFVPLYHTTQTKLNLWFPEFSGKIIIPKEAEPQLDVSF